MNGRVPLARRSLFLDRRRALLAVAGVAAALLLVAMLQGIFDGAMRQVTAYLRSSPADVIVSQRDVRTMHMSSSALSPDTTLAASRVPGVAWAEAIRYTTTFLANDRQDQVLSYVIGYDPTTGRGGPRRFSSGRAPRDGEIALEEIAATRLGVHLGDRLTVFDSTHRVVGLFRGGTTIVNSLAFVTSTDFAAHRGPTVAYVLVGAKPGVDPATLAARVATALPADTVQTRPQFIHQEATLVKDMSADLLRIMTTIGFLIALAVVALTLFSLTVSKLHEYAVVKALGGHTARVAGTVVLQAVWLVAAAVVVTTLVAVVLSAAIGVLSPSISVAIEPASITRIALWGVAIGVTGALIPLRRIMSVDPASAFRRQS